MSYIHVIVSWTAPVHNWRWFILKHFTILKPFVRWLALPAEYLSYFPFQHHSSSSFCHKDASGSRELCLLANGVKNDKLWVIISFENQQSVRKAQKELIMWDFFFSFLKRWRNAQQGLEVEEWCLGSMYSGERWSLVFNLFSAEQHKKTPKRFVLNYRLWWKQPKIWTRWLPGNGRLMHDAHGYVLLIAQWFGFAGRSKNKISCFVSAAFLRSVCILCQSMCHRWPYWAHAPKI